MEIRSSDASDRPGINLVRNAAWRKAYPGILPPDVIAEATSDEYLNNPASYRAGMRPTPEAMASRVGFVSLDGERITGFVAGGLVRDARQQADCELWALYVDPAFQGRGIGRRLFNELAEAMRLKKHRSMVIWVLEENAQARGFYERVGARLSGARKMFRWDGREIAAEVCSSYKG
jgi:ribosomal protein S18 acetylase RimI-like enzyme